MVPESQETPDRIAQLQRALRAAGLDGLVLRLAENVLLATGWFVQCPGSEAVVVPAEGGATLLVPDGEVGEAGEAWDGEVAPVSLLGDDERSSFEGVLGSVAAKLGLQGGSIGYEGSFEFLGLPSFFGEPNAVGLPTRELICARFATERIVDFSEAIEELRVVKTDHEIELIRRTNEIAAFGLRAFREAAVPGATEVEVMAAVERAIAVEGHGYRGARWVRGYATVCSGPQLADIGWQFFRSSTRRIEPDDVVMVELGTVADGFWSDHTRTLVAGTATSALEEAHAAVREAVDAALAAARPGAAGGDVDAAARAACADRGFAQHRHPTGHGTGFVYHEYRPLLAPDSEHLLRNRAVIAVEPGIYDTALGGGVRHEIDAVVTERGGEELAPPDEPLGLT